MALLGVNIDHVATLRQARYRNHSHGMKPEPDPVSIAIICEEAGASSITAHLREDRRHIQDEDVRRLRKKIRTRLNLEMAATNAMVELAIKLKPDDVCLVPENRQEITTEGGLHVTSSVKKLKQVVKKLSDAGITVSLFIDPELEHIQASAEIGAPFIELHTGSYANATTKRSIHAELKRHVRALQAAAELKLGVNAGHGLHYNNLHQYISVVPLIHTLNIGHAIVSRSVVTGFRAAVLEMISIIQPAAKASV